MFAWRYFRALRQGTRQLVALALGVSTVALAYPALRLFYRRCLSKVIGAPGGAATRAALVQPLEFSAAADPHLALQRVLRAIRAGAVPTLGQLVYILRGQPTLVFAEPTEDTENNINTNNKAVANAYRLRVPIAFIVYLQEYYLPATRAKEKEGGGSGDDDQVAATTSVEREMMRQLVAADVAIRALEVERATTFDNAYIGHTNLLQQLWLASGQAMSSYRRTGPHWAELGFQGDDPITDLRGGGVLALRQLVHFAQTHTGAFRAMIEYNKQEQAANGESWYLLAVVSIHLSAQLVLQRDHALRVAHLEVVYDTLKSAPEKSAGGTTITGGGNTADNNTTTSTSAATGVSSSSSSNTNKVMSRVGQSKVAHVDLQKTRSAETIAFWAAAPSDGEAGLFVLHHALLLHFKQCWERDRPHVMDYNTYMPAKVFSTFFTDKWTLPAELDAASGVGGG